MVDAVWLATGDSCSVMVYEGWGCFQYFHPLHVFVGGWGGAPNGIPGGAVPTLVVEVGASYDRSDRHHCFKSGNILRC